jgi:hypothetical protein
MTGSSRSHSLVMWRGMRTHPYVLLFFTGYGIDVELEEEYDTMHIIPVTRTYILSLFHHLLYYYTMDLGQ